MKAIVKTDSTSKGFEVRDMPIPSIRDDEVLIEIKTIGICGTDYKIYQGKHLVPTPIIPGHEFCGDIVELGNLVTRYAVGNRVVSELGISRCMTCDNCLKGMFHMCESKKAIGIHANGTYAEYIVLPEFLLHKVPEKVSYDEATLIETLAVCLYGMVERPLVKPYRSIVIFGPGPVGLLSLQIALSSGASKVVVVGTDNDRLIRLPLAKKLGAHSTLVASDIDFSEKLIAETNGEGFDLAVECSGSEHAINSAIHSLKKLGQLNIMGLPDKNKLLVDWYSATYKALDFYYSYSSSSFSWKMAIELISRKKIDTASLISHREHLKHYENVFQAIEKGEVVKALLYT